MRRCLPASFAFALIALCSTSLVAQNVFVLPAPSSGSPNVAVFQADPFTSAGSPINLNPNSAAGYVSAASFVVPGPNHKFYIISNSSGTNNPTVVVVTQNPDGSFTAPKVVAANLAGALAAFITSDGKRLLVVSGGGLVTLIDTATDNIAALSLYFGGNVVDIASSLDASVAYVLTNTSQGARLSVINPTDGSNITSASLSATGTGLSVGPNGLVYISTQNGVVELDPTTYAPRFTFSVAGQPGKVYFTPDGKLGVAINLTPSTGAAIYILDLNARSVVGTIPESSFNGARLETLIPVGNNRVFAFSRDAGALFDVQLNPANVSAFPLATAGAVSGVAASNDVVSGTHTATQYLFFTSGNTLYRYDVASGQITGQQSLPVTPGPIVFAATPITNGAPAALLTYGDNQSIIPTGTTGPLVIRVVDAQGRPLAGVPVAFSSTAAGVTFSKSSAVTTNEGYATTTVTAASTSTGQAQITAKAGALTANLTVNIGQGPGGPNQAGCLQVIAGQGQLVTEQSTAGSPLTVLVSDANGKPQAGQQVTFVLTSGLGSINGAGFGGVTGGVQQVVLMTDANGLASVTFSTTTLLPGQASAQTQISVQGPCGTGVTFYLSTVGAFSQQVGIGPVQAKSQVITLSTGSKLNGAFTAAVSSAQGTALPNVSMFVENAPFTSAGPIAAPPAVCDGGGSAFALSDTGGVITCNLIATGAPGTYQIWLNIGYAVDRGPYTLIIQPGSASSIVAVSGDKQSGNPGKTLAQPLVVKVTDANGAVLTGVPLTWTVTSGTATISGASTATDSQGQGTATVTLGNSLSPAAIRVTAGTVSTTFNLTVTAPVTGLTVASGAGQSASVNAAFASPVVFKVVDANGNGVPGILVNISVTSGTGTVSSATATTDQQGNASVNVTAGAVPGSLVVTAAAGSFSTTATLTIIPPGPSNLVFLNGAGYQKAISPGAIVAIQGTNLVTAPGVSTPTAGGPLPTTFQGITVTFNGTKAPIFSVANVNGVQQVVVQAPYEIGTAANATVNITTSTGATATASVPVQPYAPGIFQTTAFGALQAVAVRASDGTYITPSNPAHRGDSIIIYLTGLGQTTPPTGTNQLGIANQTVSAKITVGLNNAGVPVGPVVAAPGLIGVYTATITIPSDAPTGAIPLNVIVFDAANNQYLAEGSFLPVQ